MPACQQLPVGPGLALAGVVGQGLGPRETTCSHVAGRALADDAAGRTVDVDEVGRGRHLVVEPGLGRHDHRRRAGRQLGDPRHALDLGALGDDDQAGVSGHGEPPAAKVLQNSPQVRQPLERKASTVFWRAPTTPMRTSSSAGVAPVTSKPVEAPRRTGAGTGLVMPAVLSGSTPAPSWWSWRRISAWLRSSPATSRPSSTMATVWMSSTAATTGSGAASAGWGRRSTATGSPGRRRRR